jgi:uncharacterized protein
MTPVLPRPGATTRSAVGAVLLLAASAAPLAGQAREEASFVVRIAADTLAVESFTRTADRLDGVIAGAAVGRIAYALSLGPAATVTELTLRAWPAGADAQAPPAQEARVAMRGDSAIVDLATPAGPRVQRLATREGAVPYLNPSFAQMEQVVRRARALGGERVEVPIFLAQGGQTLGATVTGHGADSVLVSLAGSEMRAAVSTDGRLLGGSVPAQGLTFTRVEGALPTEARAGPADYGAPEGAPYTAESVVVATPAGHTLAGTLTRPRATGPVPAVVLISGSGPQDRDSALPMVPGYRPFREIADTLGRRGIAVLRLDDRGTGQSTGDFAAASSADFADDVRAALAYLRGRADIDGGRLGLVGHSEGGLIAPLVAATDPALRGIVLVAGPAETGRRIIAHQQRHAIERLHPAPGPARDSVLAAADEQVRELAEGQTWLRFFLDHDPLPTARRVRRTPVLILHGATDRQVTAEQAEALAAAFRAGGNPDVSVKVLPGVNHLLLRDPDGDPAGYHALPDRRVAGEVLGALADWTASRLPH